MPGRSNIVLTSSRWLIAVALVLAGVAPAAAASEPGVWPRGGVVVLLAVALVLETAAIAVLVARNRRTRRSELAVRAQLTEIAQMDRLAAAGELSASMSHEIKQP